MEIKDCKAITLCGSMRFKETFFEERNRLEKENRLLVVLFPSMYSCKELYDTNKEFFEERHKHRISISDAILVINKGGYIGKHTRAEIEFAKSLGKGIFYYEERNVKDKIMPDEKERDGNDAEMGREKES
jgi:hypothetical protein